jgi:quercetin dioxygenase-like cupin family protein
VSAAGQSRVLSKGESIHVPSNALHGAKAPEFGTLLDMLTPVHEDLLGRRRSDSASADA